MLYLFFLGKTSTNSKPVHATLWNAFGQYAKDLHEGYVPFQYQYFQSGNSCGFRTLKAVQLTKLRSDSKV